MMSPARKDLSAKIPQPALGAWRRTNLESQDEVRVASTEGVSDGRERKPLASCLQRMRQMVPGDGILLITGNGIVTNTNTLQQQGITLTSEGPIGSGTAYLVSGGTGPALRVWDLRQGTGILVTTDAANKQVEVAAIPATLTGGTVTGGVSLVADTSGGTSLKTKALVVGDGIDLRPPRASPSPPRAR